MQDMMHVWRVRWCDVVCVYVCGVYVRGVYVRGVKQQESLYARPIEEEGWLTYVCCENFYACLFLSLQTDSVMDRWWVP